MSFMLTTEQMENRSKRVTRRIGWRNAKTGQIVTPIHKGQGLKKGESIRRLLCGPIRFTKVTREPLGDIAANPHYGKAEVIREGFPEMTPFEFVTMFCQHNRCTSDTEVTRIEFAFVDEPPYPSPAGELL